MLSQLIQKVVKIGKKWPKVATSGKKWQKVPESDCRHPEHIPLIRNTITHLVYVMHIKPKSLETYKRSIYSVEKRQKSAFPVQKK